MKIEEFPGPLTRQHVPSSKAVVEKIVLTEAQEAWFRKWFPETENGKIAKAMGVSLTTMHRFARAMHLKKSESGMKAINHRHGRIAKRTCERNGYYDSLRGKPMNAACIEGSKKMWEEIRAGNRKLPQEIMKERNPRKYKMMLKKCGEKRKEMIRKERMRIVYGMERKTKLRNVVACKYTHRQINHRYYALRRGYIIIDDVSETGPYRYAIFYDENTKRSKLFERNLVKDGFTVTEWHDDDTQSCASLG